MPSTGANSLRYHRVYCGAARPETYVLLLLEMCYTSDAYELPALQVRRLGESSWRAVNVLPVSFAILLPNLWLRLLTCSFRGCRQVATPN